MPGLNAEPAGQLTISDATPTEDQVLTVSIAGVTDADNVSPDNPAGTITGPITYYWQVEQRPGTGVFEDIILETGEEMRATGTSFTVTEAFVGLSLRVRAVYQDANGVLEQAFSAPTAAVENVNDPPAGALTISDTTPTDGQTLTASNSITDGDGLLGALFTYQWQSSADGVAWTDIPDAVTVSFTPGNPQGGLMLRIVATYTDDQGTQETVASAATAPVENIQGPPLGLSLDNFFVFEDVAPGETIATVTVDDDTGDTHTFTFSDPRFEIVGGILRLVAGASLDDVDVGLLPLTVTVTDQFGNSADFPANLVVQNVEEAPEGVVVDPDSVAENAAGAVIGTLTVIDGDIGDVHTVTLSDSRFELVGGVLKLKAGQSLNFETEPTVTLSVTATDQTGLSGTFDLTVNVTDVIEAPADILLSNAAIAENSATDTVVGLLSAAPDNEGMTYTLLNNADGRFRLVGNEVRVANGVLFDFESATSHTIQVRAENAVGVVTENIVIAVTNVGDTTPTITGTNAANTLNGNGLANHIAGLGGNDTLNGNGGNDILDGGTGNDTMNGGTGDDIFIVDATGDTENEQTGQGNDTVKTTLATYSLGTNFENLIYTGGGAFTGNGNSVANTIVGGGAGDTLDEIGGDDTLLGNGGNDTLNGGAGNDELYGGAGTDILNGNGNDDMLVGGDGNDTLNGGANDDTLDGGVGNDSLIGEGGNDLMYGAAGNDTMNGGSGNDTFVFLPGFGNDTIAAFGDSGSHQDVIAFDSVLFDTFAEVFAASAQVGANTVITVSAETRSPSPTSRGRTSRRTISCSSDLCAAKAWAGSPAQAFFNLLRSLSNQARAGSSASARSGPIASKRSRPRSRAASARARRRSSFGTRRTSDRHRRYPP